MAKSSSPKSKHTHVPSHIGFSVIALVALVFGLAVATQYNSGSQSETMESHASTVNNTTKQCISYNTSGACVLYQQTTTTVNTSSPCVGYNTSGKCVQYQGTAQKTSTFVPTPAGNKPQTQTTSAKKITTTTTTTKNYGQSSSCKNMGGMCESTSGKTSGGSFYPGLCPGPSSWQCFVSNSALAKDPPITYGASRTSNGTLLPGEMQCANGKVVLVAGSISANSKAQLEYLCATHPNSIYSGGTFYSCSNNPTVYKELSGKSC